MPIYFIEGFTLRKSVKWFSAVGSFDELTAYTGVEESKVNILVKNASTLLVFLYGMQELLPFSKFLQCLHVV